MTAAIILLVILCVLTIVVCGNNYFAVRILRKLIRPAGKQGTRCEESARVISDLDYLSLYGGTLDIYTIDSPSKQPVLLWIHGGGYVGGDKSCIKNWAHAIARRCGIAVVSVNYRLAPELRYPTPIIQISEALRFIASNADKFNLDAQKIFLGGDSAGSQIASQYAALVHNNSLRVKMRMSVPIAPDQLKGIILCCGFYNMDTVLKSRFPAINTFIKAYTGHKATRYERRDELSAVKNLGEGYCDTFIVCGRNDPFWGQACEMIDALQLNGVTTEFYLPQGRGRVGHEFQFDTQSAEAETTLRKTVEFIEQRTQPT